VTTQTPKTFKTVLWQDTVTNNTSVATKGQAWSNKHGGN